MNYLDEFVENEYYPKLFIHCDCIKYSNEELNKLRNAVFRRKKTTQNDFHFYFLTDNHK